MKLCSFCRLNCFGSLIQHQMRWINTVVNTIEESSHMDWCFSSQIVLRNSSASKRGTKASSNKVPRGFWQNKARQRQALEELGRKLGVKELDDWYSVNRMDVLPALSFITNNYSASLFQALKTLYPEHEWDPLRLSTKVTQGYWTAEDAQRAALEKFGKEHGVQCLDDWYKVSATKARRALHFISNIYNNSLFNALKTLYPEHKWDPLRLAIVPQGYWSDQLTQRAALEKVGRELFGVQSLEDWYRVDREAVLKELSFLSSHYNCSLFSALKTLYPEFHWNPLKLSKTPHGYWQRITSQELQRIITDMQHEYNIHSFTDWCYMPREQLTIFSKIALNFFGGKGMLFKACFPHHSWRDDLASSAPERKLKYMCQVVTPVEVHASIGGYSIDLYLPEYSIAIEYQGKQHYSEVFFGNFEKQCQRDARKQAELAQHGIALISIPYWWNGSWSQIHSLHLFGLSQLNSSKELLLYHTKECKL